MNTQLSLFGDTATPVRRYGWPASVEATWERAFSASVIADLLAVAQARPGEWVDTREFHKAAMRHKIGCCFGHVLFRLFREGKLEERHVYYGSDRPGDPNYQGYSDEYRIPERMAAI